MRARRWGPYGLLLGGLVWLLEGIRSWFVVPAETVVATGGWLLVAALAAVGWTGPRAARPWRRALGAVTLPLLGSGAWALTRAVVDSGYLALTGAGMLVIGWGASRLLRRK